MSHPRKTGPMRQSKRCGAKTRRGTPCQSPAVAGKERCRMHGGAKGSGAQLGNQNALKHGAYSGENRAFKAFLRSVIDLSKKGLE